MTTRKPRARTTSSAKAVVVPEVVTSTSSVVVDLDMEEPITRCVTVASDGNRTEVFVTLNRATGAGVVTIQQDGRNLMGFTIPHQVRSKD